MLDFIYRPKKDKFKYSNLFGIGEYMFKLYGTFSRCDKLIPYEKAYNVK